MKANGRKTLLDSLRREGIPEKIVDALGRVKRENFVLPQHQDHAYADTPLPIPAGQTISQPYTVAKMTEMLDIRSGDKVLEIGSGSGYQAAVLSMLVGENGRITSVERIHELAGFAQKNLMRSGIRNAAVVENDGTLGYRREAPYDRIIVTASASKLPETLLDQLKPGGKLVIPIGDEMYVFEKDEEGKVHKRFAGLYAFVPLIGKYSEEKEND